MEKIEAEKKDTDIMNSPYKKYPVNNKAISLHAMCPPINFQRKNRGKKESIDKRMSMIAEKSLQEKINSKGEGN